MRRRLLLFALLPFLAAAAHRDWNSAPPVVQIEAPGDIFAMGDVHGDYDRLAALLAGAGVLAGVPNSPERPVWAAGKSVLVFVGDYFDKGPNGVAVLTLLRALSGPAEAAGGRVVVLMGNHEAEFLASNGAAKGGGFAAELRKAGMDPGDTASCKNELGAFLCSLPFAARVGDWAFSHAGNTGGRTLPHLGEAIISDVDSHGFGASILSAPDSMLEARIAGKKAEGGAWYDAGAPRIPADRLLAGFATAAAAHHIVQGHQHGEARFADGARRQPGEMFQWRGLLFLIDTGMSREIGDSAGAILHIRPAAGQASAVCADGHETVIWNSREPQKTGKAAPCRP